MIAADAYYASIVPTVALDYLTKLAITAVYKDSFTGLEGTELVFAGYGENDFFPILESVRVRALLLDKLFYNKKEETIIDQ